MFFKIWLDKGNQTNRDQIEFLKRVNKNGVPMPPLVDDMTALDIDSTSAGRLEKYHNMKSTDIIVGDLPWQDW
jgi:hypothetical protein